MLIVANLHTLKIKHVWILETVDMPGSVPPSLQMIIWLSITPFRLSLKDDRGRFTFFQAMRVL